MYVSDDIKFAPEIEFFLPSVRKSGIPDLSQRLSTMGFQASDDPAVQQTHWLVKKDDTIEAPPGSRDYEISAPLLFGMSGITSCQQIFSALTRLGAQSNKSCGFHVHVSPRDRPFTEGEIRNIVHAAMGQEVEYLQLIHSSRHQNNSCSSYLSTTPTVLRDDVMRAPIDMVVGTKKHCKITFFRIGNVHVPLENQTTEFRGKEAVAFDGAGDMEHVAYLGTIVNFTAEARHNPQATFKEAARRTVCDCYGSLSPAFLGTRSAYLAMMP